MSSAAVARTVESLLISTGLRLFFTGASVALGLQLALSSDVGTLAIKNLIEPEQRRLLIGLALLSGLLCCLGGALYVLKSQHQAALLRLNRLARLASPLLLSFALPSLLHWEIFKNREFMFAVVATLFGLATERSFRASMSAALELGIVAGLRRRKQQRIAASLLAETRPAVKLRCWLRRHAPALMLSLIVLAFAGYMLIFSVRQHYQLKTYSWDLGIFNNLMYNLLRGHWFKASPVLGPEGSHIQFHATFGAYLLAPLYALWQRPETLIALQACLVAAGAVPLYLIAKLRLNSSWIALVFAYAYLAHAPLHGPLFYDFHFLTISQAFVLAVIYAFESGRRRALVLAWLVAISMREEVSATLSLAALYYLLVGRRPRWALWGGLVSAAYFLTTKFVVMPAHAQAGQSFSWIFQGLIAPGDTGFGGVLRTLATNPVFTFSSVFTVDKFEYLLRTMGPVLLLVMRRQLVWVLCLPAFIFTLLSTGYEPMIQTSFQYTANWTPYVMVGSIFALEGWRQAADGWVRFAAAVPALCVTATLFSYNFGSIYQRNTFVGGFHKVDFSFTEAHRKNYANLHKLVEQIPESASVSACELLVPHLSSREDAFTFNRVGASGADYLLCSTDWLPRPPVSTFMRTALGTGAYSFVARSGMFAMWKKGGDHAQDAVGLRLLGANVAGKPTPAKAKTAPLPQKPASAGGAREKLPPIHGMSFE